MANDTATPNNYGQGLSDNGGGVYITEWTSAYVRVWFFARDNIPASVTEGTPDVSQFGLPMANFQGSCDIDTHLLTTVSLSTPTSVVHGLDLPTRTSLSVR